MSTLTDRLLRRAPVDPEWARRGRCIYHRPASLIQRYPRLLFGIIAVWTGFNAHWALTQREPPLVTSTPPQNSDQAIQSLLPPADQQNPSSDSDATAASVSPLTVGALKPLPERVSKAAGSVLLGAAFTTATIFYLSRTVRRLHVLIPKLGSGQPTQLMVENVLHSRARGRIFNINDCFWNNLKGEKDGELYLRVKDLRGSWMVYTTSCLVPNLPLGPNEKQRIKDELNKVFWDYKSDHTGMERPLGLVSPSGLYHSFPYEPSVRDAPRDPDAMEPAAPATLGKASVIEAGAEVPSFVEVNSTVLEFSPEEADASQQEAATATIVKPKRQRRSTKDKGVVYEDKSADKLQKAIEKELAKASVEKKVIKATKERKKTTKAKSKQAQAI